MDVPAQSRGIVRFEVAADVAVGLATFQFLCSAGAFTDASEVMLPVYTPAVAMSCATYGELGRPGGVPDAHVVQIVAPQDAIPQFGGLTVSLSSTALQGLADSLIHLVTVLLLLNRFVTIIAE